eukprot:scaffold127372_cov36-Phaeocystis_antarctica.AAC.1
MPSSVAVTRPSSSEIVGTTSPSTSCWGPSPCALGSSSSSVGEADQAERRAHTAAAWMGGRAGRG